MHSSSLVCLVVVAVLVHSMPTEDSHHDQRLMSYIRENNFIKDRQSIHHVNFLEQYGFLEKLDNRRHSESNITLAIEDMQRLYNLPMTGEMDEMTEAAMRLPRCGVSDHHHSHRMKIFKRNARGKRYQLEGSRWHKREIKYKVTHYSTKVDYLKTDAIIAKAFGMWSQVVPLDFIDMGYFYRGPIDVEIFWATGQHGDNFPFHGPGGVLAHCFYPRFGSDAHFDDSENWVIGGGPYGTINLIQVMAHEFGHGLGLLHSVDKHSIMKAYYAGYDKDFKLGQDDITAAQMIYGPRL